MLVFALLTGCRNTPSEGPAAGTGDLRVVSLAPNLTELMYALQAGDRLVGRSRFCDHPHQVLSIPVVSGGMDPDIEAIFGVRPTLVLVLQGMRSRVSEEVLAEAGVRLYSPRLETLDDIYRTVDELGELTRHRSEAQALLEELKAGVASFPRPGTVSRRVALVYGHRPLVVAGGDSWGDELIRLAGHQNVFGTESRTNVQVDAELLLVRAPEIIVDLAAVGTPEVTREFWREFRAQTGHAGWSVVVTGEPALLRPGIRVVDALLILSRLITEAGTHD